MKFSTGSTIYEYGSEIGPAEQHAQRAISSSGTVPCPQAAHSHDWSFGGKLS